LDYSVKKLGRQVTEVRATSEKLQLTYLLAAPIGWLWRLAAVQAREANVD
jgi:hypothetical protein